MEKRKDGRVKNGNPNFKELRPATPRKKYPKTPVMLSIKVQPETAKALRGWAAKEKGRGYGALIEKLVREYFELTEI